MNLKRKPLTIFVALLMFGPLDVVWGNADAKSAADFSQTPIAFDEIDTPSIIGDVLAISDAILNDMRGGFTTTSGLEVAFGIERALYVNGELISTTSLNVVNLSNVSVTPVAQVIADVAANLPTVAELSSPTSTAPQTNTGAPTTSTSIPSSAASSSAVAAASASSASSSASSTSVMPGNAESSSTTPAAAPSAPATTATTSAASGNTSPSTQIASVTSTPGSVALIQSGAGNAVSPGAFSAASLGTVVQNTLNNQKIQNVTVISATVNSMEVLKALNLQSAIGSAINDSVRK